MGINRFIVKRGLGIIIKNKKFSDLTTMKVGGKIKTLYYPNNLDSLLIVLDYLQKRHKKFFILGNGSNLIVSDKPYKNLVINGKHLIKSIEYYQDYFIASAFMDLRIIIAKLIENQIATLTNLAGIPATLGGALVMNASAFKQSVSDNLLWVRYIDNGKVVKKDISELKFYYRNSEFKKENIIILEAAFKIIKEPESLFVYRNILEKRRQRHPLNYPNSGSIFRNGDDYFAYEIIRKINLVDYEVGGAKFSEKHANFIINFNNAKAKDIYNLIILAKKRALILENIELREEVILLNFPSYKLLSKYLKK